MNLKNLLSTIINKPSDKGNVPGAERKETLRYCVDIFSESSEPFFFLKETFIDCNKACARLFGVNPSDIIDHSPVEFSPINQPDGSPSSSKAAVVINAAFEGRKQSFLWRHKKIDGTTFDAEVSLTLMKSDIGPVLFGSMRDVTERLRSDHMLSAAKERLSVTLTSISEGVITTDLYGQTELINPTALDIIGMELHNAIGRHITEILVLQPDFAPLLVTDPSSEAMRLGKPFISPYSALIANSRNEHRPVKYGASPMRDRSGRIIGAVVTIRDVSETERLEKALLNTQRIESLGVLAGGIAHDFNNLLAGLFGYVEMGQRHLNAGRYEKANNCLTHVLSVFDKARSLTQQLLTFSKGGDPIKKVFSITSLLEATIPFASSGGMLKIESSIETNLPDVEADEGQLGQVIDNIIINAKQAMPNGGVLRIRASNAVNDKPPTIKAQSCIKIEFEDDGPGIPNKIIGKLFDPFFTTKPTGNGLGLSTAFSIIRKHGGHIEAESSAFGGALFRIWLPATGTFSSPIQKKVPNVNNKFMGSVLVMDDDPLIRETLSDSLTSLGLECVVTNDGNSALLAYKQAFSEDKRFSLVILDLAIPGGMGGRETLKNILSIDPAANVVATSGYVEDPILAKPHLYGFKGALPKPSTSIEIGTIVNMFCKTL